MARNPKKPGPTRPTGLPGAAKSLPVRVAARMPIVRRWVVTPTEPAPTRLARLLPRRVAVLLPAGKRKPAVPQLRIPLVTPMLRGVREPLERTAAVVQVAREARKPRTRWERLRDAARKTLDDPVAAARWEHLMGLGVGLATRRVDARPAPARSPLARLLRVRDKTPAQPTKKSKLGLRGRLQQLQAALNENAGPRRSRDRRSDRGSR